MEPPAAASMHAEVSIEGSVSGREVGVEPPAAAYMRSPLKVKCLVERSERNHQRRKPVASDVKEEKDLECFH